MRIAARGGQGAGGGFSIICRNSQITQGRMRKNSSDESLDSVKLTDRTRPYLVGQMGSGMRQKGRDGRSAARGARINAERVNLVLHQLCKCAVDQAMTLNSRLTAKSFSDYKYTEMSFAISCAGVTGMQMTIVYNSQFSGRENRAKPTFDFFDTCCAHGDVREARV